MNWLNQRIAEHGIRLCYVSPTHDPALLLKSYVQRAKLVKRLNWNVPLLCVEGGQPSASHINHWLKHYFPQLTTQDQRHAHESIALAECLQKIARQFLDAWLEIDPWDIVVWCEHMPAEANSVLQQALQHGGFLPQHEQLNVINLVALDNSDISFRLTLSPLGFGDGAKHFLLRYFLDDSTMAAAASLFASTAAKNAPSETMWVEVTRGVFEMEDASSVANSLVFLRQLVQSSRQVVQAGSEHIVLFCEMPHWFGTMTNLHKFGEFPLLHGVDLLRVA